jgi:O-antigen/teichoic acid export membrane protein
MKPCRGRCLKYLLPVSPLEAQRQLGIFGACYKMSILMTLFVQAYKMAAEPFFFYESTQKNPQLVYAKTMNYFIIVCCFIFLMIMLFINFFKLFMGRDYYEGLTVVPVLLLANFFLGVYYNLTIWYKLTNKNNMGALVSVYGAVVTIALKFLVDPDMGLPGIFVGDLNNLRNNDGHLLFSRAAVLPRRL